MVERFHRQLKAAIMAHESPNPWTTTLPAVLLGARSAGKELLGRSAAEIVMERHSDFRANFHISTLLTHIQT